MKPVFERVPVAFEKGDGRAREDHHGKFQPLLQPSKPFLSTRNKKESSGKKSPFLEKSAGVGNVSATVTATPIKCKIVCITFNWVWNVKKKGSQRSWSKNAILRGRNGRKRIVLFLEGKLASRTAGLSNLHRSRVRGDNTSIRQPSTRSPLSALFLGSPFLQLKKW